MGFLTVLLFLTSFRPIPPLGKKHGRSHSFFCFLPKLVLLHSFSSKKPPPHKGSTAHRPFFLVGPPKAVGGVRHQGQASSFFLFPPHFIPFGPPLIPFLRNKASPLVAESPLWLEKGFSGLRGLFLHLHVPLPTHPLFPPQPRCFISSRA